MGFQHVALFFMLCACAHRTVAVPASEVARASGELTSTGTAIVRSADGEALRLVATETVDTPSGPLRLSHWLKGNCKGLGACDFDGNEIRVERVDSGETARSGLLIAGGTLAAVGTGAAVGCATGMLCDSEKAKVTGAVVVGGVAVLLLAGVVAFASCKRCWAFH